MAINWRQRATVFQLLAAVYAELGEEAFRGRYISIAKYFGPDATYDSIKSFFAKEVSRAADQLKAQNPEHHGSGRRAPPRPPSRSSRPPHLYFDDEDLSILTRREAEAHFGHTRRVPAKRPRVIKVSEASPDPEDVIFCTTAPTSPTFELRSNGTDRPTTLQSRQKEAVVAGSSSNTESASYVTAQSHQPASGDQSTSNKRPFSAIDNAIEARPILSPAPSVPSTPHPETFGYVTKQGKYRCALCLSQLPTQEDLNRHESLSNEHLRNLKNQFKLSKGREKLTQVRAVSAGPHQATPAPPEPLRINGLCDPEAVLPNGHHESLGPSSGQVQQPLPRKDTTDPTQSHHDIPLDTIEVRRRTPSFSLQTLSHIGSSVPIPPPQCSQTTEKGKGKARAASIVLPSGPKAYVESHTSSPSPPRPSLPGSPNTPDRGGSCPASIEPQIEIPRAPFPRRASINTQATSVRTEIGSITPHQHKALSRSVSKPAGTSLFSPTDLADIMRSTEMMIQLMSCVQREAVTVASANGISRNLTSTKSSLINGVDVEPIRLDASPAEAPSHAPNVSSASGSGSSSGSSGGVARRGKSEKRMKDTGDEVFFIVLD
ncbi:hypothetical protein LTR67_001966 [Exophiala xenobiotica]